MVNTGMLFEVAWRVSSYSYLMSLCVCRVLLASLDLLAELDPLAPLYVSPDQHNLVFSLFVYYRHDVQQSCIE